MTCSTTRTPATESRRPVTTTPPWLAASIVSSASLRVDRSPTTGSRSSRVAGTVVVRVSSATEGQLTGRPRPSVTTTYCSPAAVARATTSALSSPTTAVTGVCSSVSATRVRVSCFSVAPAPTKSAT